jgi:hypothetical protein
VIKLAKFTFVKKCSCGKDVEFVVDGIPDNLGPTKMASDIRLKQPEQPIKQNQLSEALEQQSKQEDATDRSMYSIGNKNAKGPHKQYAKGKLKMS